MIGPCHLAPIPTCMAITTACCGRTAGAPRRTRRGTCCRGWRPTRACSTWAAARVRSPRTWRPACPAGTGPASTQPPTCWRRPRRRRIGGEPDAGRHMLAWARQAGFTAVEASGSAWCYTGDADRAWWGASWADRLTKSPFGDRAVEHGLATRDDLERLAQAWLRWADSE